MGEALAAFGMESIADQGSLFSCVGAYADSSGRRIFYFLNHRFGAHQLRVYYPDTNTDRLVLSNTQLSGGGLNLAATITGVAIIGDTLYWTDGVEEPRRVNIGRALNGEYFQKIEEDILLLRRPPLLPLGVAFAKSNEFSRNPRSSH